SCHGNDPADANLLCELNRCKIHGLCQRHASRNNAMVRAVIIFRNVIGLLILLVGWFILYQGRRCKHCAGRIESGFEPTGIYEWFEGAARLAPRLVEAVILAMEIIASANVSAYPAGSCFDCDEASLCVLLQFLKTVFINPLQPGFERILSNRLHVRIQSCMD